MKNDETSGNANFLPTQYARDNSIPINHNYLYDQFSDRDVILNKISKVVERGDFTLGAEVDLLEEEFALMLGARYAIAVGSGTDALFLSLKAHGVGPGDEVITTPFTFYATIGAIATTGAVPIFVDISRHDYNIDWRLIEAAITPKTKAIIPVHWAGRPCDMQEIMKISDKHHIPVIEDACHSVLGQYNGQFTGTFGATGCFSFHPLKNLNVWGDGGIVVTNSAEVNTTLRLLRNHGLTGRDECVVFGFNSRLDTVQAVVARHLMGKLPYLTGRRIEHAHFLDHGLSNIPQVEIPKRSEVFHEVFHLYSILAEDRDGLKRHLIEHGIDAKVHYPKPMHLQSAANYLNHKEGDFPVTEDVARRTISLPVHEFITEKQLEQIIETVRSFYSLKMETP